MKGSNNTQTNNNSGILVLSDAENLEYRKLFSDNLIHEFPELEHNSIQLNEKVDFLIDRLINYPHEQFLDGLGIDSGNEQGAQEMGLRYNQPLKIKKNTPSYDFGIN